MHEKKGRGMPMPKQTHANPHVSHTERAVLWFNVLHIEVRTIS